MKLMKRLIAASSFMIGSTCLLFAVSNLEFQEYTSSPLIDWKILFIVGLVAYAPFAVHIIRRELSWRGSH